MEKRKEIKTRYRVLFILVIVAIFFFQNYYPCLRLNLSSLPPLISKNMPVQGVLFLYGEGVCENCPNGKFLISIKERRDILVIVPHYFDEHEMKNLRAVFMLKNTILKGDEDCLDYVKGITACKKADTWRNSFFVRLNSDGKIKTVTGL